MEIRNSKDFWKFIVGFMTVGALWLAACYRLIEGILGRDKR